MNNEFIEIESRHGRLFYINVASIECVHSGDNFRIIDFIGKDEPLETFESYEDIKNKIENAGYTISREILEEERSCSNCRYGKNGDTVPCHSCIQSYDKYTRTTTPPSMWQPEREDNQ